MACIINIHMIYLGYSSSIGCTPKFFIPLGFHQLPVLFLNFVQGIQHNAALICNQYTAYRSFITDQVIQMQGGDIFRLCRRDFKIAQNLLILRYR